MVNPFLKWPGGKRWLVSGNQLPLPSTYLRYVEPFLGSGAVFFHVRPQSALLADLNEELINLYQVIRDMPCELLSLMQYHQKRHTWEYYYNMRSNRPRSVLKRAGRFLYLNRTCWNGLYRVNLNGDFNVPIGTKDTVILSSDNFENIADLLREVDLRCADFEEVIDECGSGDFLFVDPPYTVQHNYNNFVKYNEKIFSWGDQIRLRDAIKRAISREASVAITNADHKAVRKLYEGICYYTQLNRYSILAGEASKRGLTTEALFLANIPT